MKKILLFASLFGSATILHAQDINTVNKALILKQIDVAKTELDKILLDPKQAAKPDVVFLKGSVYNELSKNTKLSTADAYANKVIAFESYKNYLQLDKKAKLMTDQSYFPFLEIYAGFSDLGGADFNNKNFGTAFKSFVKAQEVEDFIFEKGYTYTQLKLNKLDTNLILNTAASAINSNDSLSAVKYYTKLVDAGLNGPDHESIYDVVVRYYMDKGDANNFNTNLAKAQKAFPKNPYWTNLEMDYLSKNDRQKLFVKYEENFVKNPDNKQNTLNYGIDLYNKYYDNTKGAKDSATSVKLINILKAAAKNGDETNNSNILLANHLYNVAADLSVKSDAIKSLKPADVKRKKDLVAKTVATLADLIPYAENSIKYFKALPTLKISQKVNYRAAAGYLAEAYKATKNVAKAAEYDKLMNSISIK
jgi:hypothetical protein